MAKTKAAKAQTIEDLKEAFRDMKSVVFANFDHVKVKQADALRRACRAANVRVIVAKKTLIKKALVGINLAVAPENYEGGIASFFSLGDEVAGPQIIRDFGKTAEGLKMLGGVIGGVYYDSVAIEHIASLPSRENLLGMVVSTIAAPLSSFVSVLNGTTRGLLTALNQIKESKT